MSIDGDGPKTGWVNSKIGKGRSKTTSLAADTLDSDTGVVNSGFMPIHI